MAHYLGMLSSTARHFEDADRHFTEGLALNQRIDVPPYVAYTRYEYAKMLAARSAAGDRERAVAMLDDALVTAREIGMVRLVEQAEALRKTLVD